MGGKSEATLPIPARRALRNLGADIRDARRRRRIPTKVMAERAMISRMTLNKVEKGDSSVTMGIYATVLFVLGMTERLEELAAARHDSVGLTLEGEKLPQRIRNPRPKPIQPYSEPAKSTSPNPAPPKSRPVGSSEAG